MLNESEVTEQIQNVEREIYQTKCKLKPRIFALIAVGVAVILSHLSLYHYLDKILENFQVVTISSLIISLIVVFLIMQLFFVLLRRILIIQKNLKQSEQQKQFIILDNISNPRLLEYDLLTTKKLKRYLQKIFIVKTIVNTLTLLMLAVTLVFSICALFSIFLNQKDYVSACTLSFVVSVFGCIINALVIVFYDFWENKLFQKTLERLSARFPKRILKRLNSLELTNEQTKREALAEVIDILARKNYICDEDFLLTTPKLTVSISAYLNLIREIRGKTYKEQASLLSLLALK